MHKAKLVQVRPVSLHLAYPAQPAHPSAVLGQKIGWKGKKGVLSPRKAPPTLSPHLYFAVFRQKFLVNEYLSNKARQELKIWTLSRKENFVCTSYYVSRALLPDGQQ